MKITFIRPNFTDQPSADAMEPLVFAVLAGLTPPDVTLELFDERVEPVPATLTTDLVAMTVETYTARRAYLLADRFRRQGLRVVMGGYHPTFMPDEALPHADAVVIGEAEGVWPQLLADAEAGNLQPVYRRADLLPLTAALPNRRIFAGKRYVPVGLVQYGRGCRFACDFCSIHAFYGSTLRRRPLEAVIAEIQSLNRRFIFLVDDNLFTGPAEAEALFTALIPLKIKWGCQISIDVTRYPRLLDLMAQSGCVMALIGFESLEERNLAQMKKQWALNHADYAAAVKQFQSRGIMVYATFVFGYDYDTAASFGSSLDFALRSNFFLANFNPLTPTPGTPLYNRLRAEDRLIHHPWWLDSGFQYGQAMFHPRGMTAAELTAGCFNARRAFNTAAAIGKRLLAEKSNRQSPAHLYLYLAGNIISRREIYRKQGLILGGKDKIR